MKDNIIGKYTVLEELSSTPFDSSTPDDGRVGQDNLSEQAHLRSQVFKATDPGSERLVTIRLFPAKIARYPQLIQRLRDALRVVAKLTHPSIPLVIGSGMHDGRPYIVTPFISAGSLEGRLKWGALSALDIGHMVGEIADALHHAHSHGIIHGDLKPSNILFDENGQNYLADLGLAPVLQPLSQTSASDTVTDRTYKAPEVLSREGMTAYSDQFSLGVIILEILTRQPATKALNTLKTNTSRGTEHSMQPQNLHIDVPKELAEVLNRALADNPHQRFSSIEEMNRAFQIAIGSETVPKPEVAHEIPIPSQPLPKKQPHRKPLTALAAIVALVLCFAVTIPAMSANQDGSSKNIFSAVWSALTGSDRKDPPPDMAKATPTYHDSGSVQDPSGENAVPTDPTPIIGEDAPKDDPLDITDNSSGPVAPSPVPPTGDDSPIEPTPTSVPPITSTQSPTPVSTEGPAVTSTQPPTSIPTQPPTSTQPPPPPTDPPPPPTDVPPTKKPKNCSPAHPEECPPTPES